ncbi:winged helix-turn-helix domain-containing protein [Streptomyces hyaluromycini]|uniref:Winged helix-turn-helix domain-containing protein n=1 Tax=Streptomyces hyaluromycini TaxID=1377993 RepID=A0ABV1XBS1_9ACTN
MPGMVRQGDSMVFRIHFTTEDLARTTVAEAPMPLVELNQAARTLQNRDQSARLTGWRNRSLAQLSATARVALDFIPSVGWSPTFISAPRTGSAEELIEHVRATPTRHIRTALDAILPQDSRSKVPSLTRSLVDSDFLGLVCDGLGALYEILLAPYWPEMVDAYTADRSIRMRQVLHGGVEQLLSQANPTRMRWKAPVLEIRTPTDNTEYNLHLAGRGLLLVPSMMRTSPVIHYDAAPRPAITYPALPDQPLRRLTVFASTCPAKAVAPVAALLGATRAAVLTAIAENPGCSTTELAAFAGLAPSSASEHATVLREAGLISTIRHRNSVLHSPNQLGLSLLNRMSSRFA